MIGITENLRGEFRQLNLDSPIQIKIGDKAVVVGNSLIITRNGVVVGTRNLETESLVPLESTKDEVINNVLYFKERKMSGVVATLVRVRKNLETGTITFDYSDSGSLEFANGQQAFSETDYLDTDNTVAKHMLVRKTMLNSPDEVNLTSMVGATCAIDCQATQPVSVRID